MDLGLIKAVRLPKKYILTELDREEKHTAGIQKTPHAKGRMDYLKAAPKENGLWD